jgi:hypothetical protein
MPKGTKDPGSFSTTNLATSINERLDTRSFDSGSLAQDDNKSRCAQMSAVLLDQATARG